MKGIFFVVFCLCLLFSGCLASVKMEQKKPQEGEILLEPKPPYGKYTIETADVEVWFYDDFFIYLDRDKKVLKNYQNID